MRSDLEQSETVPPRPASALTAGTATVLGAVIVTVGLVALLHGVYGQFEPVESMFGLVYLIVPFFTLPLGAFIGRLIHYWRSPRGPGTAGPSQATMLAYGVFGVTPIVLISGFWFYHHTEHLGAPGVGLMAFAALGIAAAAVVRFLVSGRRIVVAIALSAFACMVFSFADRSAHQTQVDDRREGHQTLVETIDTLVLPSPSSSWSIETMEMRRFQDERTVNVALVDAEGDVVTVQSRNEPVAVSCEAPPPWARSCEELEPTVGGRLVTVTVASNVNFATRYDVTFDNDYFSMSASRNMSQSKVVAIIDELQIVSGGRWLEEYYAS